MGEGGKDTFMEWRKWSAEQQHRIYHVIIPGL